MKLQRLLPFLFTSALAATAIVGVSSCNKSDDDDNPPVATGAGELKGDIAGNRVLTADSVYTIKGYVYVKEGGMLTIPAGTVLKSDIVEKAAIIVERGGKIMAEGTVAKPIVFTSGQPKGQRRPGDWGGIILLGKAPTNRSTEPTIEGGVNRQYGGSDANDNSGVMKYVRIEFAGIAAAPGSEINGLTMGGVGAGTTIENIMVSYGNDDGYEFFGGTVNAKNLISFATNDDDFDFDFGYVGKLQYGLAVRHPQYADVGDAGNGIECDNDGTGTNATPFTHPKISNFTFIGPNNRPNTQSNHNYGTRFRRSTHFTLRNSVIIGFQKGGFSVESSETGSSFVNGTSEFKNNMVHAITKPFFGNSGSGLTDSTVLAIAVANGSSKLDSANAAQITNPWSLTAPNFTPLASSPAASGANFAGMDAWFQQVTFRGAIGTTDWTQGWTNWDPNNTDY